MERWPAYFTDNDTASIPESILSEVNADADNVMSESNDSLGQGTEFATHRLSRTDTSLEPNSSDDKARGLAMPSDVLDQERMKGLEIVDHCIIRLMRNSDQIPQNYREAVIHGLLGTGLVEVSTQHLLIQIYVMYCIWIQMMTLRITW